MLFLIVVIIVLLLAFRSSGSSSGYDSDPIDEAIDKWDNRPEDLDVTDMFWLDEIWGDD